MSQQSIDRVQPLVDLAEKEKARISRLDLELKEAKKSLRKILDVDIPELMNELCLATVTTKDGLAVEVVPFTDCSIPVANKDKAMTWLRDNGYGDLIKRQVIAAFGAGEDEVAEKAVAALREYTDAGAIDDKQAIHPQTLKAWAREQLAEGVDLPDDVFSIYTGQTTKIKKKK